MRKFNASPKRTRRFVLIIGIFVVLILLAAGVINAVHTATKGLQEGFSQTGGQADPYDDAEWGEVPLS